MAPATDRKTSSSSRKASTTGNAEPYGSLLEAKPHVFDKGWSWAVDIGVFLVSFLIVGWFRCYGVIFIAIQDIYWYNNFEVSWVGTANAVCFNFFSPLGSILADRFSSRSVVMSGGILMATGLIAGRFCYSLPAHIATIGVLHGIGAAFAYVPAIVMLGTYFRKRMGLATGIAFAGSSCSQLIMPALVTYLIDTYGLNGTLLILGGLALNICVSGATFFPVSIASIKAADDEILKQIALQDFEKKRKENPIVKRDSTKPVQTPIPEENDEVFSDQPLVAQVAEERETNNAESAETEPLEGRFKKQMRSSTSSTGAGRRSSRRLSFQQIAPRLRRFSVRRMSLGLTTLRRHERLRSAFSSLRSPIQWMLMLGYGIGAFVFAAGMKYVPAHATEHSVNRSQLALMLALCGIPDILIRVSIGCALDTAFVKTKIKRYRIFGLSLTILGTACFIIPFTRTFVSCLLVFVFFGLGVGMFFTTSSVACFDLMGRDRYRVAYAWMLFLACITHTIDSIGVAKLRDVTSNYMASFFLMGSAALVASVCVFSEMFWLRSQKAKHPDW